MDGKLTEKLHQANTQAEHLLTETQQYVSEKKDEIEKILRTARETSSSAGVSVFTQDFQQEIASLDRQSNSWLITFIILAVLSLVGAVLMWLYPESGMTGGIIWQKMSARIAILLILISLTFWAGKIYKALRHQATVTRHKALSIQTLQAFSNAVEDPGIRDTVVMEAARAVFRIPQTGYVAADSHEDGGSIKC